MRALLVTNPAATTTTAKVREVLVRALSTDLKVDVAETTHRGHARELGRQAAVDGVDVVVTLGGDGTVNETVDGLLADGPGAHVPALAVVPGGSTNVFSRALGRSRDPVEAIAEILDSLRAGRTRRVSLGTASALVDAGTDIAWGAGWTPPRWFVFAAGLGFDAEVIRRVEEQRARGRRSSGRLYVHSGTRAFLLGHDRRHPSMTLRVPGEPALEGLFLCLVSNVNPWTYLGDRAIAPSPEAGFENGLAAFAMGRLGPLAMLRHLRATMAEQPDVRGRGVHRRHDLAELEITSTRPLEWQLDGDHLGPATGLRVRSVPAALEVVV